MISLRTRLPLPGGYTEPVEAGRDALVAVDPDGTAVGVVQWRADFGVASASGLWSGPGATDVEVFTALRAHAVAAGVRTLTLEAGEDQPELLQLLHDAPLLSTYMTKAAPSAPPPLPPGFAARDMTADEYARWKRVGVEEYAESNLARCGGNQQLAVERALESFVQFLPDDAATADTRLLTLTQDGRVVGDLWVRHHWPRHRNDPPLADETFTFDVKVAADRRGEGLGRAAMLAAERFAVEVGDGRLGLNVFGGNDAAIGLYRSLGYAPVSTVLEVPLA